MRKEMRGTQEWIILDGSDSFEARDSAHVEAWGSAHVEAWGSAHVVARGSAHVEAWGSAHVEAWDSAHVVARDSAHVEAWGSAHVEARDSAHVEAWDFVSIVKKSAVVTIKKGGAVTVIIPNYPNKIKDWAALKNLKIINKKILLWKAVTKDGYDFRTKKVSYLGKACAPDWDEKYKGECGYGLHLADSPSYARIFVTTDHLESFRLFQVSVDIKDCVCFGGSPSYPGKVRAKQCKFVKEFPRDYRGE